VGPRAGLDVLKERNNSLPLRRIESQFLGLPDRSRFSVPTTQFRLLYLLDSGKIILQLVFLVFHYFFILPFSISFPVSSSIQNFISLNSTGSFVPDAQTCAEIRCCVFLPSSTSIYLGYKITYLKRKGELRSE
jgi:hypothetical protein